MEETGGLSEVVWQELDQLCSNKTVSMPKLSKYTVIKQYNFYNKPASKN